MKVREEQDLELLRQKNCPKTSFQLKISGKKISHKYQQWKHVTAKVKILTQYFKINEKVLIK